MSRAPLFSITIANWNGGSAVLEAIESVLAQPAELFELFVVDNGSTDGSARLLRDRLDDARKAGHPHRIALIAFASNLGYGAAHNRALPHGRGELVLALDSDAFLAPDFLEAAAGAAGRFPETAMFAAKLYRDGAGERLDNLGLTFCADGQNRGLAHGELDRGQYEEPMEVFCPSGAAGLYRREALERTGYFDEDYFAYGEDFELGLRLRRAGGHCRLMPQVSARHVGSSSLGASARRRLYLIERNRIWTLLKHFPLRYLLEAPGASLERFRAHWERAQAAEGLAGAFVKAHGGRALAQTTLGADLGALRGAPKMLWKRLELARKHPLPEREFRDWIERFGVSPAELARGV